MQTGVPEEAANQAKTEKRTDRLFNHNHSFLSGFGSKCVYCYACFYACVPDNLTMSPLLPNMC